MMNQHTQKIQTHVQKQAGTLVEDRLILGGSVLILQLAIMIIGISMLGERWLFLDRAFSVLSLVMIVWLIRKYDNPAYKIAWIIVILIFPLFGGIFYLFWGNTPFNRAKKIHQIEPLYFDRKTALIQPPTEIFCAENPDSVRISYYIECTSGTPVWNNTQAVYFPSGLKKFESLKVELATAERFIFMEYFILEEGEMWNAVLDILVRKVKEGLDVRVMYDDAGCITKLPLKYDLYLQSLGIRAVRFNRFIPTLNTYLNNRDHRKICVIDGNTGYIGGINLADEYIGNVIRYGYWKDTAVMLRGDAVANLTQMFLQLWDFSIGSTELDHTRYLPTMHYPSDGYIQPFADSPLDKKNVAETVYMRIINSAKHYVYITTPYLVLDNEMITALTIAAQSGIDVRIVTPGIPDKAAVYAVTRSFYQQLICEGVKIYEYRPGFIHAKMIVADDNIAVVGTINMDFRSFYLHFECGSVFYEGSIPRTVREDIEDCIAQSREIDELFIHSMPWPASIAASVLRVFSPLL